MTAAAHTLDAPGREGASDESLLERSRRGDAFAYGALVRRHWAAVHRVALNMLGGAVAAAEVAETVFLSVPGGSAALGRRPWPAPQEAFPAGVNFRVSLMRVVLGESWRRLGPVREIDSDAAEAFLPRFDDDGRLDFGGEDWLGAEGSAFAESCGAERIRAGLLHLDTLDRAAFLLREVERLPVEEVALVLGIPPKSVRERTHRSLLLLTGFLSRAGGGAGQRC